MNKYKEPIYCPKCNHKVLTNEEEAYLAGIVDGEGSLRVFWGTPKNVLIPELKITSTSRELMDWLGSKIGGHEEKHTRFYESTRYRINCKPAWFWRICKRNILKTILELIYPYLTIKKYHTTIILDYFKRHKFRQRGQYALAKETYDKLKILNKRGRYEFIPN